MVSCSKGFLYVCVYTQFQCFHLQFQAGLVSWWLQRNFNRAPLVVYTCISVKFISICIQMKQASPISLLALFFSSCFLIYGFFSLLFESVSIEFHSLVTCFERPFTYWKVLCVNRGLTRLVTTIQQSV